jgi:hypothetical protein
MYLPLKKEICWVIKLAMQLDCNGPSIVVEQAKTINGLRRQEARQEILNSLALLRERNVGLTILSSPRISLQDRTLYLVPTLASFVGNRITIKVLIGHVKLTNWSLHICLTQQSWGALCIFIAYTTLFGATGNQNT